MREQDGVGEWQRNQEMEVSGSARDPASPGHRALKTSCANRDLVCTYLHVRMGKQDRGCCQKPGVDPF